MARQRDDEVAEARGASTSRRLSGLWGGLLTLAGFGALSAGLALVFLPRFQPQYAWSVAKLAQQGVTGGPLAICGVLLVAFGWLARGQARLSRQLGELPDGELILEHVAQELSGLREGVQALDARHNLLRESTQGLIEAVQARESLSGTDADARDSIFRLAASLDRLGARLEQGELARHAELRQVLALLEQRLDEVTSSLQAGASAVHPMDEAPGNEPLRMDPHASLGRREEEPALGLLDALDDQGQVRAGASLRLDPGGSSDDRLDELRSLLSDARVRQALDSLQLG